MRRNLDKSRLMFHRAQQSLAGGVSSPFRATAPVPLYFTDGRGARLTDVDGNEYIDYLLAWGPMILGYNHPKIVAALKQQAERPSCYGAQHETEIAVAEQVQRMLPCAERVAFTSSGSEAVQLAHRLARAFTGRPLILKFEGHYHGWMDSALISHHPPLEKLGPLEAPWPVPGSNGQVANAVENVVVAPWNRLDILQELLRRHRGRIAGVIMEPVLCNSGCILPRPGYLDGARELCSSEGALLIFDEVITGFRLSTGGAQKFYNVTPDLATLGKAAGGGVPLSMVAGRREIMDQMFHSGVVFGGTFNGNPISLAGANATLDELARDNGAALAHAKSMGQKLIAALPERAARHGIPLTVTGFGTAFTLHFSHRTEYFDYRDTLDDDKEILRRFLQLALEEGIQSVPDGRMYVSAAHTQRDVDETLAAMDRAFAKLADTTETSSELAVGSIARRATKRG